MQTATAINFCNGISPSLSLVELIKFFKGLDLITWQTDTTTRPIPPQIRISTLSRPPRLAKRPICNIPNSRYSRPRWNIPQGERRTVPIVPSSRTICVVRPGGGVSGDAHQLPLCSNQDRVAGLGECSAGGRFVPPRLAEQERAMRRGILGSIIALVAGAGTVWGQAPMPISAAGGVPPAVMAGDVIQVSGPAPILQPPLSIGPSNDPMGWGPTAEAGPPPGPMYPMPGPYGEPLFQPPPPGQNGDSGYGGIPRFEFWGGYSLWFAKSQAVPYPLLTTSAPSQNGILGASSTTVLAGAQPIAYNGISGLQFATSWWGDDDRRFGVYVDGFYTENRTMSTKIPMIGTQAGQTSADIPVLARPYIDTTIGPTSLVVGGPNLGPASALVTTSTETWGVESSAMFNLFRSSPGDKWFISTDLLIGYKFLELKEDLAVITNTFVNASTSTPVFTIGPGGFPIQTLLLSHLAPS
jgi:hypothetical protein